MPLVSLKTSVALDKEKRKKLLAGLSKIVAEDTGKPVQFVMATVEQVDMVLGRDTSPSAFVDVRSIGALNRDVNASMSARIAGLLHDELGIEPDRAYLNFTDVKGSNWGAGGGVFGA